MEVPSDSTPSGIEKSQLFVICIGIYGSVNAIVFSVQP